MTPFQLETKKPDADSRARDRPEHAPLTEFPRTPLSQHPSKSVKSLYPTLYTTHCTLYQSVDPDTKISLKAHKTHFVHQLLRDKSPGELEN